jgi:hypothetical protein
MAFPLVLHSIEVPQVPRTVIRLLPVTGLLAAGGGSAVAAALVGGALFLGIMITGVTIENFAYCTQDLVKGSS